MLAYNAATIGILGALAFFANQVMNSVLGIDMPWQAWAAIAFAIVAVLSYFEVTLSAKVLGLALLCEVSILLAFDVGVLLHNGFHGFSLDVFKPSIVFGPGFGVTLMLAFGSYVGFEATALYGEEAKNPHKAVPRATYIALAVITGFYLLTTWAAISAYGVNHAQAAAGADPTGFLFAANAKYVGGFTTDAMQLLVITSLFAAFLAFHCNTARYHYALARDGLLPKALSHTHPKYGSPIIASAVQLAIVAIVVIAFAVAGQNPYLQMGTAFYGLGVLGIVLLQAIASTAVVGFFLKRKEPGVSKWGTIIAPSTRRHRPHNRPRVHDQVLPHTHRQQGSVDQRAAMAARRRSRARRDRRDRATEPRTRRIPAHGRRARRPHPRRAAPRRAHTHRTTHPRVNRPAGSTIGPEPGTRRSAPSPATKKTSGGHAQHKHPHGQHGP